MARTSRSSAREREHDKSLELTSDSGDTSFAKLVTDPPRSQCRRKCSRSTMLSTRFGFLSLRGQHLRRDLVAKAYRVPRALGGTRWRPLTTSCGVSSSQGFSVGVLLVDSSVCTCVCCNVGCQSVSVLSSRRRSGSRGNRKKGSERKGDSERRDL